MKRNLLHYNKNVQRLKLMYLIINNPAFIYKYNNKINIIVIIYHINEITKFSI